MGLHSPQTYSRETTICKHRCQRALSGPCNQELNPCNLCHWLSRIHQGGSTRKRVASGCISSAIEDSGANATYLYIGGTAGVAQRNPGFLKLEFADAGCGRWACNDPIARHSIYLRPICGEKLVVKEWDKRKPFNRPY